MVTAPCGWNNCNELAVALVCESWAVRARFAHADLERSEKALCEAHTVLRAQSCTWGVGTSWLRVQRFA